MAINSNETSANNFAAFQSLAMQINGTSTNTNSSSATNGTSTSGGSANSQSQAPSSSNSSSPSSPSQNPNGAVSLGVTTGLALGSIGALFVLLL